MSWFRTALLLLVLILPVSGYSSFDPARRLVIAPAQQLPISAIDRVLDDLFASGKPVVLYVHGRGNEPEKTARSRIIETLELEYGVKVLMFNWDSKGFLLHRPVNNAEDAAHDFKVVVEKILRYRDLHPASRAVPVSLLAHSMGTIVLQKAVENGVRLSDDSGPLFTNILLTGSDADAEGHRSWVEKLQARRDVIITVNRDDLVLSWSQHDKGRSPLGQQPKSPLAPNARYLDLTGLVGDSHRLFLKSEQHGQAGVCRVVTAALRSEDAGLLDTAMPADDAFGLYATSVPGAGLADSYFAASRSRAVAAR